MTEQNLDMYKMLMDSNKGAGKLAKELSEVQGAIRGLKKDALGSAGGAKVTYVSGDKVIKPIMAELAKRKILLHTSVVPGSIKENHRTQVYKSGEKYVIDFSAVMFFQFILGDETISGFYSVTGNQFEDSAKAKGTAETYGERYFLLKYFKIATDADDSDARDLAQEADKTAKAAKTTSASLDQVKTKPVAKPVVEKAPAKPAAEVEENIEVKEVEIKGGIDGPNLMSEEIIKDMIKGMTPEERKPILVNLKAFLTERGLAKAGDMTMDQALEFKKKEGK